MSFSVFPSLQAAMEEVSASMGLSRSELCRAVFLDYLKINHPYYFEGAPQIPDLPFSDKSQEELLEIIHGPGQKNASEPKES